MNPYALLATVVGLVLSHWLAYSHGVETEQGRAAIKQQKTVSSAIEIARSNAEAESERRKEIALRNARSEAANREARLKGQINALRSSRAECRWTDERLRDFGSAIDAANGSNSETGVVSEGMPTTTETAR